MAILPQSTWARPSLASWQSSILFWLPDSAISPALLQLSLQVQVRHRGAETHLFLLVTDECVKTGLSGERGGSPGLVLVNQGTWKGQHYLTNLAANASPQIGFPRSDLKLTFLPITAFLHYLQLTESQNHQGWRRPLKSTSPTFNLSQ